jgi:hypothetical protein
VATISTEPAVRDAVLASESTLRRIANYQLPEVLDRRILDLGERKDSLTGDERAELFAWVAFTQQRSLDKLEAEVALNRISKAWPDSSGT